jgi:hypothetical protein
VLSVTTATLDMIIPPKKIDNCRIELLVMITP